MNQQSWSPPPPCDDDWPTHTTGGSWLAWVGATALLTFVLGTSLLIGAAKTQPAPPSACEQIAAPDAVAQCDLATRPDRSTP